MHTKLEKPNIVNKIKAIVKYLIVAFFFSAFFLFLFYLTIGNNFEKGLSILNSMSINKGAKAAEKVTYDAGAKKLSTKPSWGDVFGTIKIPSISLELPIVHGDSEDLITDKVGHYAGSYFPGEGGSVILPGHNSYNIFHFLPEVNIGDTITIETTYGTFNYEVLRTAIIGNTEDDKLPVQDKAEVLMLYTCYPVDSVWYADYRYVIYAKLVGDSNE